MAKQRKVNDLLGKNWAKDHEKMYQFIEETLGVVNKKCSRSTEEPHPKYGFVHEGPNPLSIREFNFQRTSKDLLQPNCRKCEKKYRKGRSVRNHKVYDGLSDDEVRQKYIDVYGEIKQCGRCKRNLFPSDFPISRGMESGLHNMCIECQSNYQEAMGDRWIIYSPDGRTVHKSVKNQKCINCGSVNSLHKDHRWPVALGGTDHPVNFQVLCQSCNSKKKVSVAEFHSVQSIHFGMICERYHDILAQAKKENWYVRTLEIQMKVAVQKFIAYKASLSNEELRQFFLEEKRKNNRKHDVQRCIDKFRKYYRNRVR